MGWLRKRAEQLISGETHDCDSCDAYNLYPRLHAMAEQLAREFAERALWAREGLAYNTSIGDVNTMVAKAIEAADEVEP